MASGYGLRLHEEALLLALHDEKGTLDLGSYAAYAAAGAIVAELMLEERIRLVEVKRKRLVEVANPKPTGDALLDETLRKMAGAKKRASVETWVSRVAGTSQLSHRVARRLCQKGVLRANEKQFLLLFRRKVYPQLDPRPEQELVQRLRQAVLDESAEPAPRTLVLLALAKPTGLLGSVLDKRERKAHKARIEALAKGEELGAAVGAAAEAVHAAVVAATSAAAMVAVVAATS